MPARWAWGDAARLDTLTKSADVVFSGTVVRVEQRTVGTASGGGDASGQAPRFLDLPLSEFELHVESVVSGNLTAGSAIVLQQLGGVETRPDGTQVRIMLNGDDPLRVGEKYLLFASFQKDGSMTAPPFGRMKVRADGSLVAEEGWGHLGALKELSLKDLAGAEQRIAVAAGD
jgi:hypothetical protein